MGRKRSRRHHRTMQFLPVIKETETYDSMDDVNSYNQRMMRKTRFQSVVIATLFVGLLLRPYHSFRQSSSLALNNTIALKTTSIPASPASTAKRKYRIIGLQGTQSYDAQEKLLSMPHNSSNYNNSSIETIQQTVEKGEVAVVEEPHTVTKNISIAPLVYHISPGSTGSRTFYHASCTAGFPSVHHKSFCISQTRGIHNVDNEVVTGVRSHFELLRLYEMAADCCSLWNKGKIQVDDEDLVLVGDNNNETDNRNKTDNWVEIQQLCNAPVLEWIEDVQFHLTSVLQSGLVGLFDTPYPYLAPQLLALAGEWRSASPIIAMTERDPQGWAASRSRNHGILVCKDEYSFEGLGASEFDIVGCIMRAHNSSTALVDNDEKDGDEAGEGQAKHLKVLHFWDVFQYRSHNGPIDPAFQSGMERQMKRHQELYLPMAQYAPDMFGLHSSLSAKNESKPIKEEDVVDDIRAHILIGKQPARGDASNHSVTSESSDTINNNVNAKLLLDWRNKYTKSLTCRGRVNWEIKNDTQIEYYRLPKTCGDMAPSKKAGKVLDNANIPMIPLISL
mmetsp:Transcript_46785/g.98270  ORF Transcript_46785/g.98270 Transcript_46785/m.98270 type:complete len:561 (-) Transcript_46785:397-2079(-)|eukprot:CAMPEP_0183730380 /NCGR_PEP_ID=MMETSP0737-20130205/32683_1 /TAXON_ID=385413 /ORGANISM="Thalassiosira miniscula, Strain CCMP1093" /LENGTH=560 /DNA_ID=CAMNT_0025962859 /DNA_START=62 /DNA_END=1744 /DNA_ORIENTATION=+